MLFASGAELLQRRVSGGLSSRLFAGALATTQPLIARPHFDCIFAMRVLARFGYHLVTRGNIALGLNALLELAFIVEC